MVFRSFHGFAIAALLALSILIPACDRSSSPYVSAHDDLKDLAVTNVDPYPGQSDYHLNDPIVITFTAPVDPTTANSNTIQITDPNGASPQGRFEVIDNQVLFWPQYPPGFSAMTNYTVTMPAFPITPTLMNAEGTPLKTSYTFSFTTGSDVTPDTTNPYVISISPASGATNVSRDSNITVTFSEPIDSTSAQSAFSLRDVASGSVIAGTLTLTNNTTVLHFDPEPSGVSFPQYLSANTLYEVQLSSSIRDISGNSLANSPYTSQFTTGTTPTQASSRGPFIEDFTDNTNEDATQTTAEWNTVVAQALVSQVHPQSVSETDFGPNADPTNAIAGPFETGTYRAAHLILNTWFVNPLSTLGGKRITRLFWKHSGTFVTSPPPTYNNLVVRLGHTTLATFPTSPPPAGTSFSSLYMSGSNQIPPTVVSRLNNYTPTTTAGPGNGYVEIPIVPNFIFSGNAADHLVIDIEVSGGTVQNLLTGDNQATSGAPVICRAVDASGSYDLIQTTDNDIPYFIIEFGGSVGGSGVDGALATDTSFQSPVGNLQDISVSTGGTLDTSQAGHGYGHMKIHTMYVAQGATLNVIGPNPCIIRATGTIRIDGRITANGNNGGTAAGTSLSGGQGGTGGPGGGAGGMGGNGNAGGAGSAGSDGTGFDNQQTQTNGAGLNGSGGAAGAGGGGGGYAIGGSAGVASGAAPGGLGGNVWGSQSILFLAGGSGGGGGGGGTATQAAGGGGAGGGGGYVQIATDRNMYLGDQASITCQGGRGGNAAALGQGGGGGGGSGGAIYLQALALTFTMGTGSAVLNAQGGLGGQASAGGGAGAPQTVFPLQHPLADGRVRIDANMQNLTSATINPTPNLQPGLALSGVYNLSPPTLAVSDAYSNFIDTGCSSPEFTTAQVQFSASASPQARVFINFIAADPDILSQPTVTITQLYPNPEMLPGGGGSVDITLGGAQAGYIGGVSATQTGTSLNGRRFIRFHAQLDTTGANTTASVTQVTINYRY